MEYSIENREPAFFTVTHLFSNSKKKRFICICLILKNPPLIYIYEFGKGWGMAQWQNTCLAGTGPEKLIFGTPKIKKYKF